jgi:hypothetical protein
LVNVVLVWEIDLSMNNIWLNGWVTNANEGDDGGGNGLMDGEGVIMIAGNRGG